MRVTVGVRVAERTVTRAVGDTVGSSVGIGMRVGGIGVDTTSAALGVDSGAIIHTTPAIYAPASGRAQISRPRSFTTDAAP